MEKISMFKCNECGRTYNNELECKICEDNHIKPIEIVGSNAESGLFDYYPSYVSIKFDNGEIKNYYSLK